MLLLLLVPKGRGVKTGAAEAGRASSKMIKAIPRWRKLASRTEGGSSARHLARRISLCGQTRCIVNN